MSDTNDEDRASEERRAKLVKAGVAVGIGSAAIVAALLYAAKRPPRADLGTTVARHPQRPADEAG